MEKRDSTQFAIVSFTGDASLNYEDIKKANNGEIGFHFAIDPQGQIFIGRIPPELELILLILMIRAWVFALLEHDTKWKMPNPFHLHYCSKI